MGSHRRRLPLRRFRNDGGDRGRLERVDEAAYGGVRPPEIELTFTERVAERLVPEIGAVERREFRADCEVDIKPRVGKTKRCLGFDDDPVPLRIVGEMHVDDEATPRKGAGVKAAVEPPQQEISVEFVGDGFAERPFRAPLGEAEDDRLQVAAGGRELVGPVRIVRDHAGAFELIEPPSQQCA